MALFDGSIRSVVGDLGKRSWFSSEKARTTLGWTNAARGGFDRGLRTQSRLKHGAV